LPVELLEREDHLAVLDSRLAEVRTSRRGQLVLLGGDYPIRPGAENLRMPPIARAAPDSSVRKLLRNAAGGGIGPGGVAPKDVAEIVSDFLREKLGQGAVRQGSDMENMLRKMARRNPGLAERATELADQLRDAKEGAHAELDDLTARGRALVQREGASGLGTPRKVEDGLRNIARQSQGRIAEEASELADQMRQARRSPLRANRRPRPPNRRPRPQRTRRAGARLPRRRLPKQRNAVGSLPALGPGSGRPRWRSSTD
jgi:hypothetical protein